MSDFTLEQALTCLSAHAKEKLRTEKVSLEEAHGRVLAEAIYAPISNPPFDRSPLDGYAFFSEDSKGASKDQPVYLKVIGEVCAGDYFAQEVPRGTAIRIMTGAPIPKGCDCVLRQEDTDYGEETVGLYKNLKPYENYCFKGEDIEAGSLLLRKNEKLTAIRLGILASMGISEVKVKAPLKMALLCTGDEIVEVGTPLQPGKIYNSNNYMIKGRAKELGVEVVDLSYCEDQPQKVAEAILEVLPKVDLVVTTGGVSVGKKDIMHEVIQVLGAEKLFWRIQIQPGTPVLASLVQDKLLLSLSGNPFAALTNFELLVRPVISELMQDETIMSQTIEAQLCDDFNKVSRKRRFIRAYYEWGKVYLKHKQHASGALYSMSLCNALIDIPAGTERLQQGEQVKVILL